MSVQIGEAKKYQADMSEAQEQVLSAYVEAGLPSISKITESDVFQWFNLYMSGRNYSEIASQSGTELCKVLYIANKYKWYDKKSRHYESLMDKVDQKLSTIKGESISFLIDMMSFVHKYYGQDIAEYLKTNDREAAKKVDFKNIDKYFKTIDALSKMLENPDKLIRDVKAVQNPSVNVNLNLGDAKISKNDDGSVLIESNPLKQIAELKRQEQKKEKK